MKQKIDVNLLKSWLKIISDVNPLIIILLFILVFIGEKTLPLDGNFIGGLDVRDYTFWNAFFTKKQYLSGSVPLWNPHYYSGQPFMANPQTFTFYPFTLLFVVLPLHWAFNFNTIIHLFLAGAGTYYFLYTITKSKSGSLSAALIYCLSGYFIDGIYAGHLAKMHAAALLPWVFFFVEKGFQQQKIKFFAFSGAVIGLQILGGGTQHTLYTALFVTIYFFIRSLLLPTKQQPIPFQRLILAYPLIPLLAFCIGAIQILPSKEFVALSDRAENTFKFATYYSYPLKNFFAFLVHKPDIHKFSTNWEFEGYIGILSLVLAFSALFFKKYRQLSICFGIMATIAVSIMLGEDSPVYKFYYNWVPGISTFRIPSRCILLLVFSMASLAGLAVNQLVEFPQKRKIAIALIWLGILVAALYKGITHFNLPWNFEGLHLTSVFFVAALIALSVAALLKKSRVTAILLVLVLFSDLCVNNSEQIPQRNYEKLMKPYSFEKKLMRKKGLYRVAVRRGAPRAMAFNYQNINGYSPICLKSYYRFIHKVTGVRIPRKKRHQPAKKIFQDDRVKKLGILGIRYDYKSGASKSGLRRIGKVVPRAWLVKKAVVLPNLEDHIKYMKKRRYRPQKQVLLEKRNRLAFSNLDPILEPRESNDNVVKIKKYMPNRIDLWVKNYQKSFLVLSELFYPGWKAFVNGEEVPILRANYMFRAINLGPGQGRVSFRFKPTSLMVGASITMTTLLAGIAFWAFGIRRRRKQRMEKVPLPSDIF